MKKFLIFALVLVLTMSLMAGCRRKEPAATTTAPSATTAAPTTRPTTAPTTRPTTMPTTEPTTMPSQSGTDTTDSGMEDLLPGTEDTVDPSSGANQATGQRSSRMPGY